MRFLFEDRGNGLTYVEVFDGDKAAGAFSLETAAAAKVKAALAKGKITVEDR